MTKHKLEPNDFRLFELKWEKGLYSSQWIKLTQLELLKLRNSSIKTHNIELASKLEILIKAVDHETNTISNIKRKLPYKTNGIRVKQWEDIKHLQTLD